MTIDPAATRRGAAHLVLALLAAVCGLAFAPAFGGDLTGSNAAPGLLVAAVLTGALVPAVVVAVARERRYGVLPVAAVGLVTMLVAVAVTTRPGTDVFAGPYRLLTSALPADPTGPGTAAVGILTGFASLAAALTAGYARYRALSVLPPLVCLFAALALDAGVAPPPGWFAAVVIVAAGGALALIRDRARRTSQVPSPFVRVFPLVGAAAILTAGALLGTSLASTLPAVDRRPADARNLVDAPLKPRKAINPMLQYPAFARGVQKVRLTGTSSRRVEQLPLVTLSGFDGQTWTSDAQFRRAGRTLQAAAATRPLTLEVDAVDARNLSWLVRPDRPTSLDRDDLGIDESSGDLVVPGGVTYPTRYRVSGDAPLVASSVLDGERAVRRTGPVSTGASKVPGSLTQFARRTSPRSDYLQLAGLQNLLRTGDFYLDDTVNAPTGNGYFQLNALLSGRGRHLGTSEQYAGAFAVMARILGFRSRLVMGFAPQYAKSSNRFTITGSDVRAWPQVQFADAGWVTFDPTPTRSSSKTPPRENPAGAAPSPSSSNPGSPSVPPSPTASSAPPQADSSDTDNGPGTVAILLLIAAVVVVMLLVIPPGAKYGRRRRRRAAPVPAHAVYGAWRETADRLAEIGRPPQRGRTAREVAADAPRPARDDVHALGRILDRAGYAPEDAGPDDAAAAWQHADTARDRIRSTLPTWRRLLASLDPRPLWRR